MIPPDRAEKWFAALREAKDAVVERERLRTELERLEKRVHRLEERLTHLRNRALAAHD